MQRYKAKIALVLFALAAPQAASAGETVEFTLTQSELASSESRQELLDRMEHFANKVCDNNSPLYRRAAVEACAQDIVSQLVSKIGNEELSLLASSSEPRPYLSASR